MSYNPSDDIEGGPLASEVKAVTEAHQVLYEAFSKLEDIYNSNEVNGQYYEAIIDAIDKVDSLVAGMGKML